MKPEWENNNLSGFTLIESTIVLIVIGLVIGGILIGTEMMNAATICSQIAQIQKFQTAVHAFQDKYGYLPGDIPAPSATNFGFIARGTNAGQGDGNGILEGWNGSLTGLLQQGETVLFWRDLSDAGLVDGKYVSVFSNGYTSSISSATHPLGNIMPESKIGNGNYIYTYSSNGINYYTIRGFGCSGCSIHSDGGIGDGNGLSVLQAYNIDNKIDDGLPYKGNIVLNHAFGPGNGVGASWTCDDNNNDGTTNYHYSLGYKGGSAINCDLKFPFE